MRRTIVLLATAVVLALSAAPAFAQDGDKDCPDFASHEEAQAYFEANGGSPTNNVDRLDADGDGLACEDHDYGDGGGTGGDDGAGGGEDSGNGELPFTGPGDATLPAGAALLVTGLTLVGVTRYRARHARR
jgi:opacity protein-like surface antigen